MQALIMPAPSTFGQEVRRHRKVRELTLEQLAERSGLTPNYIGTVENGRRDPSLSTILALAKGLDVPPGELLGGSPSLSPSALELARLVDCLPSTVRMPVVDLLRAMSLRSQPQHD